MAIRTIIFTGVRKLPANTLLGNNTGSTGPAKALTPAEIDAMLGSAVNPFDQDLNTTDSPTFDGVTLTDQVTASNGTNALPGYVFSASPSTGFVSFSANVLGVSFGGANKQYLTASEVRIGSGMSFGFSSAGSPSAGSADVSLWRDAANTLAQRNGTNAQTLRIYETYTDSSNYERGFIRSSGSGYFQIGTEAAGTGVVQNLSFLTNGTERIRIDTNFINAFKTIVPFVSGVNLGRASYTFEDAYIDELYSYNSYTDASNYERGAFKWDSNALTIGTESLGTGSGRNLNIERDGSVRLSFISSATLSYTTFRPNSDGTSDLGAESQRWANAFSVNGDFSGGITAATLSLADTSNAPLSIQNTQTVADGVDTGIAFQFTGADYGAGIKSVYRGGTANANKNLEFYAGGDSSTPRFEISGNGYTIYQRNGTNAQEYYIFNTYTDDSNYELGFLRWGGNALRLGTSSAGTGTDRDLVLLPASGNVGIGTNSPNGLLNLHGGSGSTAYIHFNTTATGSTTNDGMTVGYNAGGIINVRENLGLYFSTNDTSRWQFEADGDLMPVTTDTYDIGKGSNAVNNISLSGNLTNYNTFTDASNYESGVIKWDSSIFTIDSQSLGTGTTRNIEMRIDGTPYFRLQASNGRIGIGNPQPTLSGDLNIGGARQLYFRGGNSYVRATDGDLFLGGSNYDSIQLLSNQIRIGNASDHGGFLNIRNESTGDASIAIQAMTSQSGEFLRLRNEDGSLNTTIEADGDFMIYNTYTDGANYERFNIGWTSDVLFLRTQLNGTGIKREMEINSKTLRINSNNSNLAHFEYIGTTYWNLTTAKFSSIGNLDLGDSSTGRLGTLYGTDGDISNDIDVGGNIAITSSNKWIEFANKGGLRYNSTAGVAALEIFPRGTGTPARMRWSDDGTINMFGSDIDSPATLQLYNTYTDTSNYERGFLRWDSERFQLGTEELGTGSARHLSFLPAGAETFRLTTGGTVRAANAIHVGSVSADSGEGLQQTSGALHLFSDGNIVANINDDNGFAGRSFMVRANGVWPGGGSTVFSVEADGTGGQIVGDFTIAGDLILEDSTTPTNAYIYNSYTDASNYERGFLKWDANDFVIGTEAAGTGSLRSIIFEGGNVGFGTTSPATRVEVQTDRLVANAFAVTGNNSNEFIKMWVDDTTAYFQTGQDENLAGYSNLQFRLGSQTLNEPSFTVANYASGSPVLMFKVEHDGDMTVAKGLGIHGVTPPAQSAHIADVSSGTDAAYETAINAVIAVLEAHGLTATS